MPKSPNSRSLAQLLSALLPFVLGYLSPKKNARPKGGNTGHKRNGGFVGVKPAGRSSAKSFPKPSRSVREARKARPTPVPKPSVEQSSDDPIPALFKARQSDTMVTVVGKVVHLLADDREGDRHQRWLMETPGGITIKISHNIDLSDRVPVTEDDMVRIRGEYEWNDKGGLIHWTHYDPKGWHEDGWIEHEGKYYGTK